MQASRERLQQGQRHRLVKTPHLAWEAGAGRNRGRERPGFSCRKWDVVESVGRVLTDSPPTWLIGGG